MDESNDEGALPGAHKAESPLTVAVRRAVSCAVLCTSCADAGVEEVMDLPEHLRDGPEIGDVCEAMAWLATRRNGANPFVLKGMLEACATACDQRAEFCGRYDHPHCIQGAQLARQCASDCRAAQETI